VAKGLSSWWSLMLHQEKSSTPTFQVGDKNLFGGQGHGTTISETLLVTVIPATGASISDTENEELLS